MEAAMKLYEITDALESIGALLVENGGELTPEIEAQLDTMEGAFSDKVERVALYVRSLEAAATGADSEAKRLALLAQSRANAAKRLKTYLLENMRRAEQRKIETARCVVRIQKNGRPSIEWQKPLDDLPEAFLRTRKEMDGDAAYIAWKRDGALPDGFVVKTGEHLRIQ